MAGQYDFYKDHELRHYTEIVYDEITKKLRDDEYIIHKGFEHDGNHGCYNVCYISNYGSLYYSSYNQKYKKFDGPIKIVAGKNEKLPETIINAIKLEHFNSDHYSTLRTELDKYIQMATNIIKVQSNVDATRDDS